MYAGHEYDTGNISGTEEQALYHRVTQCSNKNAS